MFDSIENWCKIWRKTDLWFGKWQVSKLELWWDPFIQSIKCIELKIYRGVMCHDNEEWYKIWRRTDLLFQNWHEEFDKFSQSEK